MRENEEKTVRPRGTDSAKVIQVIKTISRAGEGTNADPNRFVTEYWSLEGVLLAISDPMDSDDEPPLLPVAEFGA